MNSQENEENFSNEFYSTLKSWVASLVFFSVLFGLSYSGLYYFKRNKLENERKGRRNHITLFLCAVGLTVALSIPILLPITILSYSVLNDNPQSLWWQWFHSNLIFGLWNYLFLATSCCLFVILPFAYFWQEAEGVGKGKGLLPHVYEATLVLLLVIALVVGLISIAHNFIYFLPDDFFAYFPFAYSLITLFGSGIVMVCMPLGFTTLTKKGFDLLRPLRIMFNTTINHQILLLEKESLEFKLSQSNCEFLNDEKELMIQRLNYLRQQLNTNNNNNNNDTLNSFVMKSDSSTRSNLRQFARVLLWFFQNGVAVIVILSNLFFPALIVAKTLLGTLSSLLHPFLRFNFLVGPLVSTTYVTIVLEILLVLYTSISAFVGLYQSRWFQGYEPKKKDTPMYRIVLNTFVILMISSALPVVSRILGLVSFDLMEYYKYTGYMRNTYFILSYKTLFVAKLAQRYFELFPFLRLLSFYQRNIEQILQNESKTKRN